MSRKVSLAFTLVLLFVFQTGWCQHDNVTFNLVLGPDGNSPGKIRNVVQDKYGVMWFAGEGDKCIYRYDGLRMTSYRHDEANPNSLGGVGVSSIQADDDGLIWIGLNSGGLDQFNPATGTFKHYRHIQNDPESLTGVVNGIFNDRKGYLWIYTDGLDRLDKKTGKVIHYRNIPGDKKSLSSNIVWTVYEDHQGVIWVGTGYPWFNTTPEDGGLNRLEPDGSFTRFMHDPKDPASLINNKIASIFEDSRDTFWVATSLDGLHTMDRKTGRFTRHSYDPNNPGKLSRPPLRPDNVNDKITFINEDSAGAIWIGTMYSGINRYDTRTKKITHFEHSHGFPDSTSWNAYVSKDGELWITTENNNLYRTNTIQRTIRSISTTNSAVHFDEDQDGNLWVATRGSGLFQFDRQLQFIRQYKHDPADSSSLIMDEVGPLFQEDDHKIWVGTDQGVRVFDKENKKFIRGPADPYLKDTTQGSGFGEIYKDRNGIFWFGRWGTGLVRYDPATKISKQYISVQDDSTTIASNLINTILEDHSGLFWVAGNGGANRFDRQSNKFKRYLEGSFITGIYEDSRYNLWMGTDKGLYLYDRTSDRFNSFFDPQSNLNLLLVGGMVEDSAKNLWMTSFSSIIRLNPASKETQVYGSNYGIEPNSIPAWGKGYINKKNEIHFGRDTGFFVFYPWELDVKTDFNVIITACYINSVQLLSGQKSPIQNAIEEITELSLPHNQNNIVFNFAAIDYREPEKIRYFTMLENYDNDWHEAKGEKDSYFYNLPPGHYVFHVKAFNSEGTKAEKEIRLTINPPWWKTWWAYCIYALLFVMALFAVYRVQKQRIIHLERQRRQQFELTQAREIEKAYHELRSTQAQLIHAEKMASLGELTAGIAHEIQNPLNFVNNFSEVNKELIDELKEVRSKEGGISESEKELLGNLEQNLEKITYHGKRADSIVKGMLQHSSSNRGTKEPTNINALADEYLRLSYHGLRAKDKTFNASMKTEFDETIGNINVVQQDIGRVILNLINNAFYTVAEKKKQQPDRYEPLITVATKKLKSDITGSQHLEISIADNGNGIPEKTLEKIFQPFFTTKPTGQGTGLGLSMSYDIIKANGGEIKVQTREHEGSTFTIVLPL